MRDLPQAEPIHSRGVPEPRVVHRTLVDRRDAALPGAMREEHETVIRQHERRRPHAAVESLRVAGENALAQNVDHPADQADEELAAARTAVERSHAIEVRVCDLQQRAKTPMRQCAYASFRVGGWPATGVDAMDEVSEVLDFDVRGGRIHDFRYRLMPVFSNLLPADAAMQVHIDTVRAPHAARLREALAVSDGLLYRRGNFNGT